MCHSFREALDLSLCSARLGSAGTRRCDEEMFLEVCGACAQCRDPSTPQRGPASERCEAPREISVYQWFRREFPRVRIDRPDLPCILVGPLKEPRGGRPKIPLELCRILPGQVTKALTLSLNRPNQSQSAPGR